jgi:ABC-type nitrate/sulfonate/bicarbonate transport system substrate-binding protein
VTKKIVGPDQLRSGLDRRMFLSRGLRGAAGLALLGGATSVLEACGGGGGSSSDRGTLDFQLSWIKNVEFAGQYLADTRGYYKEQGFASVNLLAGGPTVQQDSVVATGKAFIGISSPDITGAAIKQGAPIIAVGALFQKNPFCVMSLATSPLRTPEDMIGKKIGVQAVNEPVWNAFLKANKIDPAKIEKIPVQFDPQPLTTNEVDGWFSFFTNEPNLLKTKGHEPVTMMLDDFNYPLVSQIYVVRADALSKDRDKLKAVLKADIKGWHDSIKDPGAGAKLTVENYGKDLKLPEDEQTLESKDQNTLIVTDDTKANGIMTVTPTLVEESIKTLALAGLEIDAKKLFDLSVIEEVYKETPALKTLPV